MTRYLVVPQWQGSPSSRAMQLIDGALAIAGDLPRSSTTILDVPMEAGEALGTGVHRISSLQRVREQVAAALDSSTEPVLTVGGDCGEAIEPIAHAVDGRSERGIGADDAVEGRIRRRGIGGDLAVQEQDDHLVDGRHLVHEGPRILAAAQALLDDRAELVLRLGAQHLEARSDSHGFHPTHPRAVSVGDPGRVAR